jgi:hypothetical protein
MFWCRESGNVLVWGCFGVLADWVDVVHDVDHVLGRLSVDS